MKTLLFIVVTQSLNLALLIYSRRTLLASNLALRQQLAVYKRKQKRPALRIRDRMFWATLSRVWPAWRSALIIVKPETVMRWQKLCNTIAFGPLVANAMYGSFGLRQLPEQPLR